MAQQQTTKRRPDAALLEAARRWGKAKLLVNVNPNPQPTPEAPAAVETRRAA